MTERDRRLAAFERGFDGSIRAPQLAPGRAGGETRRGWGRGGGAPAAQHLAAELVARFERNRRALAAVALSTDTSVLTAIANDYAYDLVFERQIEALGRRGDVAFGITTSGASRNVVAALDRARQLGLSTVVLPGRDGGVAARCADVHVNVPDASTARVQEVHRTLLHVIC